MAQSSFEYGDETPQGWDPQVYRNQEGRGHGVSLKIGARPPEADEVAPRGTPAWRQAWTRMQTWIQRQLHYGATLGDMGFTREHEHGKQNFLRLSRGEYGGYRPDWWEGAKGHGRAYIDPYTGQVRNIAGSGGAAGNPQANPGFGAPRPAPVTGLTATGPAAGPSGPSATPFAPPAPVVAPSASFGGGVTAQDTYGQFPRGGRRKSAFFSAPPPTFGGGGQGIRSLATLIRAEPNTGKKKPRK